MRHKSLLLLSLAAFAIAACKDDSGVTGPKAIPPAALIRFINATVDTGTVDFRFIDIVENNPTFLGVAFRGTSGLYQRVTPGTRPVRIFVNSTNPVEAQKRLVDTTITLASDTRYTLVYAGQARGNQDRLVVIQEAALPTPPAGNIAIRALNAELGRTAADVEFAVTDTSKQSGVGADTLPPPRTIYPTLATKITNVAYLTLSQYVNLPALPAGAKDSLYRVFVSTTGSGTVAYARTPTQRGAAATSTIGALPGVQISGSVMTAVLFGGATAGSPAATSSNTTPTVLFLVDKVLNPAP